jgi:hypothetical protein
MQCMENVLLYDITFAFSSHETVEVAGYACVAAVAVTRTARRRYGPTGTAPCWRPSARYCPPARPRRGRAASLRPLPASPARDRRVCPTCAGTPECRAGHEEPTAIEPAAWIYVLTGGVLAE